MLTARIPARRPRRRRGRLVRGDARGIVRTGHASGRLSRRGSATRPSSRGGADACRVLVFCLESAAAAARTADVRRAARHPRPDATRLRRRGVGRRLSGCTRPRAIASSTDVGGGLRSPPLSGTRRSTSPGPDTARSALAVATPPCVATPHLTVEVLVAHQREPASKPRSSPCAVVAASGDPAADEPARIDQPGGDRVAGFR